MAHLGKFPFVPNMEDCKMVVKTDGAVCYIMDTFCRNMTKEDKAEADRKMIQIYLNAEMRKLSSEQPHA